jgi:hypothetical protein
MKQHGQFLHANGMEQLFFQNMVLLRPCIANSVDIGLQLGHGDCYLLSARSALHGVIPSTNSRISMVAYQHEYV